MWNSRWYACPSWFVRVPAFNTYWKQMQTNVLCENTFQSSNYQINGCNFHSSSKEFCLPLGKSLNPDLFQVPLLMYWRLAEEVKKHYSYLITKLHLLNDVYVPIIWLYLWINKNQIHYFYVKKQFYKSKTSQNLYILLYFIQNYSILMSIHHHALWKV